MKRIMPAHTYSDAPRARCFWADTVTERPEPVYAAGKVNCDVAIIGGGFTGLSAALHLAQAGVDVAVLEANTLGWGASGRNGGFCCLGGSAATDIALRRRFGEIARRAYRQTEKRAVDFVADLLEAYDLNVDRHSEGETVMALTDKGYADFQDQSARIRADLGVYPEIFPADALGERGLGGAFSGALQIPVGFALNPMKYVLGLAQKAQQYGTRIFENTAVTGIRQENGFVLSAAGAEIHSGKLIIATNGYSSDDLPDWLHGRYMPAQSNILVTRALGDDEIAAQGWSSAQMAYDERFFLHYFRLMPDRRFLFGMRGGLRSSSHADAAMERLMREHFERMFPAWSHVETPWFWTGVLSLSRDFTPYAGEIPDMPGAYTALSYHGNGIAMGSYAGALLAQKILGSTEFHHPEVLATVPKRFPLGRYRRACMIPTYTLARLRGE